MVERFKDRVDAGRQLADLLLRFRDQEGVVFALPRGGVVLGAEIARRLHMPLDLITARKIGHPLSAEYAIGAVTDTGETATNPAEFGRIDPSWYRREVQQQQQEAQRRYHAYLGDRPHVPVSGKVAIIVDDGIATGLTMEAALMQARKHEPGMLVLAVPVAPRDSVARLGRLADEVVTVNIPDHFAGAVGAYYDDFRQTTDEEVIALLKKCRAGTEATWPLKSNRA